MPLQNLKNLKEVYSIVMRAGQYVISPLGTNIEVAVNSIVSPILPQSINRLKQVYSPETEFLNIRDTWINKIRKLPPFLKILDLSYTSISKLPQLPENLVILNCSNTQITNLPPLPNSLQYLDCSNTQMPMAEFGIYENIKYLVAKGNRLYCDNLNSRHDIDFRKLFPNLEYLDISEGSVWNKSALPSLPESLKVLKCDSIYNHDGQKINKMDDYSFRFKLPPHLESLECDLIQIPWDIRYKWEEYRRYHSDANGKDLVRLWRKVLSL